MFTFVRTIVKKVFGNNPNPRWRVMRQSWNSFLLGRTGNKPGCVRVIVVASAPLLEIYDDATPVDVVKGAKPTDYGTCRWSDIVDILRELEDYEAAGFA